MATRILYVITKANWGGAQRYVYDLATAAKERGYDVTVAYGEPGLLVERLRARGIKTRQVSALMRDVSFMKEFAAERGLVELFEEIRPDIVHLNSSKAGFIGARAAERARVPRIIFTAHGWAFTEKRPFLIPTLFKFLQHLTIRSSTKVIAVSEFVQSLAPRWGIPKEKIELIPLGIPSPDFLSKEAARAALIERDPSLRDSAGALWVGTIGELHKNKGVDIGIKAWKRLPPSTPKSTWVIMGGGEEAENLAKLATGASDIHFLGFVPDAARYLKAFDLFMLPSRTEALAYVILEAGMASVPVVASEAGGIPEATGYPVGALFRVGDVDGLRDMLNAYLRDPHSLKKTGEALKQYVEKKFSPQQMLDKTFALYEDR